MIYLRSVSIMDDLPMDDLVYEGDIPFVRDLIQKKAEIEFTKEITFIVGENGVGKSTLLENMAVEYGFNREGGSKNFRFSTKESKASLNKYMRLVKSPIGPRDGFFYRGESFFNVATKIENLKLEDSYGGYSLHSQSHGQGFLSLIENRFWGHGLYILDEPESALSPLSLLSFMTYMNKLVKDDSQFIIATHSPILMAYPGALIYQMGEKGINRVELEEVDHYRITKDFLSNPQRSFKYLFDE